MVSLAATQMSYSRAHHSGPCYRRLVCYSRAHHGGRCYRRHVLLLLLLL